METGLANLQTSFEAFATVANKILAKLDQISASGTTTTYTPKAALTLYYQEEFTKSLCSRRLAEAWRQKIKSYSDQRIDPVKLKFIKQEFLSGTSNPTKFVRSIAEIVFGKETLIKTAMGKDGKPLKGLKQGFDRKIYFESADEALMKDLISLVDKELFMDAGAFEYLVRRPINQAGRDAKKSKEIEV
uniref:Uncharacterized protein n=2 Tax=Tetranychus urticae TaxID=32264 RepID=T1JV17_TETUR